MYQCSNSKPPDHSLSGESHKSAGPRRSRQFILSGLLISSRARPLPGTLLRSLLVSFPSACLYATLHNRSCLHSDPLRHSLYVRCYSYGVVRLLENTWDKETRSIFQTVLTASRAAPCQPLAAWHTQCTYLVKIHETRTNEDVESESRSDPFTAVDLE